MQTAHLLFTRAGGKFEGTFFVDDIIHHASIKGSHLSVHLGLLSHRGNVLSCLLGAGHGRKGTSPPATSLESDEGELGGVSTRRGS